MKQQHNESAFTTFTDYCAFTDY